MKNVIKHSILYLIFATSIIIACPDNKNESIVSIDSEEGLKNLLANSQGPSAISFHMDRCGWCIQMQPIFQDLAQNDQFGHITFYTVNGPKIKASTHVKNILDEEISGYPTILFMNQGEIIDKQVGGAPKDVIIQKLNGLSGQQQAQKKSSKPTRSKPNKKKSKITAGA